MRDVNDTRYYMRYGLGDWGACLPAPNDSETTLASVWDEALTDVIWSPKHSAVTLREEIYLFPAAPADNPVILSDRRGASADDYSNWYWIDEARTGLMIQSSGTGHSAPLWHSQAQPKPHRLDATFKPLNPTPRPPLVLQGLTMTTEHYLVVGVLEPKAGLLIFDMHGPDEPIHQIWDIPFAPFDFAATADGGLVILDRVNKRYWRLNRHFYVNVTPVEPVDSFFQPKDGDPARQRVPRAGAQVAFENAAVALPADCDPIGIEVLPDNSILILDAAQVDGLSGLYHFRDGVQVGERLPLTGLRHFVDGSGDMGVFTFAAHDFALSVPTAVNQDWQLFLIGETGNQAFSLFVRPEADGRLTLTPEPAYYPVRLYGGKGLVADKKGTIYYDFYERWLELVSQSRPRYVEEGVFYTPVIDSEIPDCVWHRLMLDAKLPGNTAVSVSSRAANDRSDLTLLNFQPEPAPYRRGSGSELPFVENPDGFDTFELLFQAVNGRYLQLCLKFEGDGVRSPILHELRAYYPRFSYGANYLTSVYREDSQSAHFLERFLANTEGFYTVLEGQIAAVQGYFDPKSVPADAVDWLASWFGVAFDNRWEEARKRFFIQNALQFFRMRATIPGLVTALRLVLDDCLDPDLFDAPQSGTGIRIIETFRKRQLPGVLVGDPSEGVGLARVSEDSPWQPSQGRATLHQLYRDFLEETNIGVEFPLRTPEEPDAAARWADFAQHTLGFVPEQSVNTTLWQNFLARRYGAISALNAAHYRAESSPYTAFTDAVWFSDVPADGPPLEDWFAFELVVLAMHRTAHHFTVLLPLNADEYLDPALQDKRRSMAEEALNIEKPAHTIFDIRFYWAMFRIGEVRLGDEIPLDRGSRVPSLMAPFVLGRGFILDNTLDAAYPTDLQNRFITDRDSLG